MTLDKMTPAENMLFLTGTLLLAHDLGLRITREMLVELRDAAYALQERKPPRIVGALATNPRVLERLARTGPSLTEHEMPAPGMTP